MAAASAGVANPGEAAPPASPADEPPVNQALLAPQHQPVNQALLASQHQANAAIEYYKSAQPGAETEEELVLSVERKRRKLERIRVIEEREVGATAAEGRGVDKQEVALVASKDTILADLAKAEAQLQDHQNRDQAAAGKQQGDGSGSSSGSSGSSAATEERNAKRPR